MPAGAGALRRVSPLRGKFRFFLVPEEVARTVADPSEIDEEIHALCEALIAAEGRLEP